LKEDRFFELVEIDLLCGRDFYELSVAAQLFDNDLVLQQRSTAHSRRARD
jgi:hypothetical protein